MYHYKPPCSEAEATGAGFQRLPSVAKAQGTTKLQSQSQNRRSQGDHPEAKSMASLPTKIFEQTGLASEMSAAHASRFLDGGYTTSQSTEQFPRSDERLSNGSWHTVPKTPYLICVLLSLLVPFENCQICRRGSNRSWNRMWQSSLAALEPYNHWKYS